MKIYAEMAKRLRRLMQDGKHIVSKNSLTRGLDVSDIPRDELERRYLNAAAACVLYANDYRSPLRGGGIYVNYKKIDDPVFLHAMAENSTIDADQKSAILIALKSLAARSLADHPDYAQMYFEADEAGKPVFKEGFTKKELFEKLLREAEAI